MAANGAARRQRTSRRRFMPDDNSVGVVAEQRREGPGPLALPFGQKLVGGREATRYRTIERREIDRLVVAMRVQALARTQAGMGDLHHLAREIRQGQALEL